MASKFQELFDLRGKSSSPPPEEEVLSVEATPLPSVRSVGRPRGKRSNPDFEQVTAHIRRETHRRVKLALLEDDQGQEFSELVEGLLNTWLKSRT